MHSEHVFCSVRIHSHCRLQQTVEAGNIDPSTLTCPVDRAATTGGGFFLHSRSTKAEIALLQKQYATYQIAVDQQSRTIETMQADADRLAVTTKLMHQRFIDSEAGFVSDMDRIEKLELGEDDGIEQTINDEFARSIDGLKQATAKK